MSKEKIWKIKMGLNIISGSYSDDFRISAPCFEIAVQKANKVIVENYLDTPKTFAQKKRESPKDITGTFDEWNKSQLETWAITSIELIDELEDVY